MLKFRMLALAAAGLLALFAGGSALAAAGGDPNSGDVWVDNVGQPAGPGHEMDPHLSCQDINLWGAKLADSSGSFSILGWPPSGSKEVDYSGTWNYDVATGGDQIIAKIPVASLVGTAQANGDTRAHQGYHFKLAVSQDPHKYKVFWVDCTQTFPPPQSNAPRSTHRTRAGHQRRHHRVRRHRHRSTRHTTRHRRTSRRPLRTRGFTG